MKGYELVKKIADGELMTETKIAVLTNMGNLETIITYEEFKLQWEPGKFNTSKLCSNEFNFELIEDEDIEELEIGIVATDERFKINELVRAVNKLTKESK